MCTTVRVSFVCALLFSFPFVVVIIHVDLLDVPALRSADVTHRLFRGGTLKTFSRGKQQSERTFSALSKKYFS
jgi:hypothetical protein